MRLQTNDMTKAVIVLFFCMFLAACGGGGTTFAGGGGGIVGTGKQVVASGEVTGFGSIIVNGIEFSKSSAADVPANPIQLDFENSSSSSESILRPGMIVTVSGSYNSDTGKGSYSLIRFSPELRGRLDISSVDSAKGSFNIHGRRVLTGVSTIFDGISDIAELQLRQSQGLELEVSGYLDSSGAVRASRVALKSTGFSNGRIQLKGSVGAVAAGSFVIGSTTVSTTNADFKDMTVEDLNIAGLVVEVRGTLNGTTINDARIERKNSAESLQSGESFSIKGISAGTPQGDRFTLGGADGPLIVSISGTSFFRGNSAADSGIIVAGARLEVEGRLQADGSIAARKISVESEKTVRLEGTLANTSSGSLIINGITAATYSGTTYRDSRTAPQASLSFADLASGDHLQIYGFIDGSGKVIASQIERFDDSDNIIQGPVSSVSTATSQLTILGIIVSVQSGASLSREESSYSGFAAFAAQLSTGSTIVRAKGSAQANVFSATSLEIQP